NNDYVNGYWKFDEGSGNTLGDSSGHNYDGTIYGASWTTGYKNYALSFDGVNDYVDLDNYAQDALGYNKTDDLIFSVWIDTLSTDPGIIFSISTAKLGYNPGTHIALNSDGTINFKAYKLGCGISMTSNGTYNDGNWHHIEIFYNGISANPTVEMYVDDKFDTRLTEWVCYFYADQFEKAKIGRRSNDSTNHFDGKIDELKIIKYAGGNEQNPPTIDGPMFGHPGVRYYYTFVANDPEGDNIELLINWGDGNEEWVGPIKSGEEVEVSHKWYENGTYPVKAKSKDYWSDSAWSDEYMVRIGNQAPDPPTITGPQYGDPEVEYEYTFNTTDWEGDDVYYWIEWGDGDKEEWIGPYETGQKVKLKHTWSDHGKYTIKAKVKDVNDAESDESSLLVVIGNRAPDAPTITGPQFAKRGSYEYTFKATDPDGDDIYYKIEWGDGETEEWIGPFASGKNVNVNHTWSKKLVAYTIKAKAKDIFDLEGPEGKLRIVVPKNNPIDFNLDLLSWLFERFPNAFPILRYLLGL
ncbi:MAG: hypothetical protein JSW60_09470, partial [Thermoplasmatales archaeon]